MPEKEISCEFYYEQWNDTDQRNYIMHRCNNPENTGGKEFHKVHWEHHDSRTYSCWHKNESMKFRCWGDTEEMERCPLVKKLEV